MVDGRFCERLAQLRTNAGISARDMSLTLGQNPGYINQIENKRMYPSMEMFFIICDFLKVSPQEFFSEHPNPYACRKLYDKISKLSEDDISAMSYIADRLNNKSL